MTFVRTLFPVALLAVLAACSGNLGGGQSTLPGAPQPGSNVQQLAAPIATATPDSASNVATLSDSVAPQALPTVMGWGGSITFPKPGAGPSATPNPKATATPGEAVAATSVSIGITAGVVEPSDAPHVNPAWFKRHSKRDVPGPNGLFFVSLLATSDVTLAEYPKIAFDVPRDIMAKHRGDTFALALFDPEQNEKAYKLSVADRDLASPLPGSLPTPVATLVPTPTPTPTPMGMAGQGAFTPPPVGAALGSTGMLPPERVAFAGTASSLTLKANRPVVFALYAIPPSPTPTPSPTPKPSPTAHGSPSPVPAHGSPGPSGSPVPESSTHSPTSAPSASPAPQQSTTSTILR